MKKKYKNTIELNNKINDTMPQEAWEIRFDKVLLKEMHGDYVPKSCPECEKRGERIKSFIRTLLEDQKQETEELGLLYGKKIYSEKLADDERKAINDFLYGRRKFHFNDDKLIDELLSAQKQEIILEIAQYSGINDIQTKALIEIIKRLKQ